MQKKKIFFNIKCNVIFPYKKKKQGKVLICKYKEIPPLPKLATSCHGICSCILLASLHSSSYLVFLPIFLFIFKTKANQGLLKADVCCYTLTVK